MLYWVADLSRSGRTAVDWVVLSLVALAVLFNLVQLGRRLYREGGERAVGHLTRTMALWIVGLFNTVLVRGEDAGTWKNVGGWVLVGLAAVDSVALYRKEQAPSRPPDSDGG